LDILCRRYPTIVALGQGSASQSAAPTALRTLASADLANSSAIDK
jgi:hypothetical protein